MWQCEFCSLTIEGELWFPSLSGITIRVLWTTSCLTECDVYATECLCKKLYVGRTKRTTIHRLREHRSHLRTAHVGAPMADHCMRMAHSFTDLQWRITADAPLHWRGETARND